MSQNVQLDNYPSTILENEKVRMLVYLPDSVKGIYRATRFDWSGIIGSVRYAGHEYFGYWKETHDPHFHEDLPGPVEGYIEPGLGYDEAEPGGKFIRIGVGVLEKLDEPSYTWTKTYPILDHGEWRLAQGKDWIEFEHVVESDIGYGYVYRKKIQLKEDGFFLEHRLRNTGKKVIQTDQFNHNFFMIDGDRSGPAFEIKFPFTLESESDPKGLVELRDTSLHFLQELENNAIYMELKGFSSNSEDHRFTVLNRNTGAGVTVKVDMPLYRLAFWACETTLSPENFVWISAEPGSEKRWVSEYILFTTNQ